MDKNKKQLESFNAYCKLYPEQRFWQALRNWSGANFILKADRLIESGNGDLENLRDTFYEE